jgi:hypothetical protein
MENTGPIVADKGSWGRLSSEGRSAAVVRFILPDRTVSFPYHTLAYWEHSVGETETLSILAGSNLVTIRGRRLGVLRDGLDMTRLDQVRAQGERAALRAAPDETWIQSIDVSKPSTRSTQRKEAS